MHLHNIEHPCEMPGFGRRGLGLHDLQIGEPGEHALEKFLGVRFDDDAREVLITHKHPPETQSSNSAVRQED